MAHDDRYKAFWPLLGSWENYLESLREILSKIREGGFTLDKLANWSSSRFGSKPEWTREALRICVVYTSLARVENGLLFLTEDGHRFLDTKDGKIVLDCICRNIWGIKEMLLWLREQPMTLKELFGKFKELGASWKKEYQVRYRILWLRALGIVDKSGGKYGLSDDGKKFAEGIGGSPHPRKEEEGKITQLSRLESYVKLASEQMSKYSPELWTEENTKAVFIEPLLDVLGWNVRNISEVDRGYGVKIGTKTEYVDYVLKIDGEARALVEAKALGKDLEPFVDQAISYAKVGDVKWAILTNGRELRLYDAKSRLQLLKLALNEYLSEADKLLLLSKERVRERLLDEYGEKEYHRQEIMKWFRDSIDVIVDGIVKSNQDLKRDIVKGLVEEILKKM